MEECVENLGPILWRMKSLVAREKKAHFPGPFFQQKKLAIATNFFDEQDENFFRPLTEEHRLLFIEYSVARANFLEELNALTLCDKIPNSELVSQIENAFITTMAFQSLVRDRLGVFQEAVRFNKDLQQYRKWLINWGYDIPEFASLEEIEPSITQTLRRNIRELNPFRLFLVRARRLLIFMTLVMGNVAEYGPWLAAVDQYAAPFFAHLAWIFFLPRLVVNLGLILKHVIEHPWMDEKERQLGIMTRLWGQLARRWVELSNDAGWFISGILTCFILTGPALPMAIHVAMAMQGYDLISAIFRAYHEITNFNQIITGYKQRITDCPQEKTALEKHIANLQVRIDIETRALMLGVFNFGVLFLAMCLTLPVMATFSPFLPLVGAALALAVTVVNFFGNQALDTERAQIYNDQRPLPAPPLTTSSNGSSFRDAFFRSGSSPSFSIPTDIPSSASVSDLPG